MTENRDRRKRKTRNIIENPSGRPRSASAFGFGAKNRGELFLKHTELRACVAENLIQNFLQLTTLTATDIFTEKCLAAVSIVILSSMNFQRIILGCFVSTATLLGRFMAFAPINQTTPKITALAAHKRLRNVFHQPVVYCMVKQ